MKFRTEFKETPSSLRIDPRHPAVLIGSCFTQNIARKMTECQWESFCGAGTLYNPLSIARVLDLLVFSDDFHSTLTESMFQSEGLVHSWLFDTHFSRHTADECRSVVEQCRRNLKDALERSQALVVTFGTAWCYFIDDEEKRNYVVANCHKMPQRMFTRRRISVREISDEWTCIYRRLKSLYPNLTVIFTVSPVRHLKDGFEGNARSKATLLLAIEEICRNCNDCLYFPAYEIVTDDLRDYRFYAQDLVHPSESAVEYIWELFRKTFIDPEGERILNEGNKRYKAMHHRKITTD